MPLKMSQTDLSVGEPVKNRESEDPTDWLALKPHTKRMIPTMSKATPSGLPIFRSFRSDCLRCNRYYARAQPANQQDS
jgi:hypothetical protein